MKCLWPALACLAFSASAASAQDVSAGERSFNKCRACHQLGETARNGVGPQLNGLFGRRSGSIEGYSYSPASRNSGIIWDEASFAEYIRDPRAKIPGIKMVFAGIKSEQEIKDLTAFLRRFKEDGSRTQ